MKQTWRTHAVGILLATGLMATYVWAETLEINSLYPMPVGVFDKVLANLSIGIGTTTPTSLLQIQQSTNSANIVSPVALNIDSTGRLTAGSDVQTFVRIAPAINQTGTAGYTALLVNATETNTNTGSGPKNLIDLQTGGTSRFVVQSAGNVGIGTTTPASLLHLQPTSSTNTASPIALDVNSAGAAGELTANSGVQNFVRIAPSINQTSTAGYTALLVNSTETATGSGPQSLLNLQTGGTSRMVVQSSGNVGIGTTSPTSLVHIQQSADSATTANPVALDINSVGAAGGLTANANTQNFVRVAPTINQSGTAGYTGLLVNSTETATGSGPKSLLDLQTGGTSRMIVHESGNVGIGTATPTAKLEVQGSVKIADGTQGANKVLTSNAAGLASWQPPAGIKEWGLVKWNGTLVAGFGVASSTRVKRGFYRITFTNPLTTRIAVFSVFDDNVHSRDKIFWMEQSTQTPTSFEVDSYDVSSDGLDDHSFMFITTGN